MRSFGFFLPDGWVSSAAFDADGDTAGVRSSLALVPGCCAVSGAGRYAAPVFFFLAGRFFGAVGVFFFPAGFPSFGVVTQRAPVQIVAGMVFIETLIVKYFSPAPGN